MRLSAERYEQVLAKLRSDSKVAKDRRGEPRVGLPGEAPLVAVTETGKRLADTARLRDVSRNGIGLITGQQLPPKQRFMIQLQYDNGQPLWLVCCATNCRSIEGGRFVIGARVEQLLRADQIHKVDATPKTEPVHKAEKVPALTPIPLPQMPPMTARPPSLQEADIARISKAILG